MAMYAIKDTTLTALGDAVRSKIGVSNETQSITMSGMDDFTITPKYSTNNRYVFDNANFNTRGNDYFYIHKNNSYGEFIFK